MRDAEEKLRQEQTDANRQVLEQKLKELQEAIDRLWEISERETGLAMEVTPGIVEPDPGVPV